MSHFEYVSVALALLYSFAAARLLNALPSVTAKGQRYGVHTAFVFLMLLATAATWWTVWGLREVEWNALRFVWVLTIPALIHFRAGVIVSEDPASVRSWRDYYYERRVAFHGVGVLMALNAISIPWVMGLDLPVASSPSRTAGLALLLISLTGLATAKPVVHGALAAVNLLMLVALLLIAGQTTGSALPVP